MINYIRNNTYNKKSPANKYSGIVQNYRILFFNKNKQYSHK